MKKAPWELSAKGCIRATKWERRKLEMCKEQLQLHGQGLFGGVLTPRLFSKQGFERLEVRYSAWGALGPGNPPCFAVKSKDFCVGVAGDALRGLPRGADSPARSPRALHFPRPLPGPRPVADPNSSGCVLVPRPASTRGEGAGGGSLTPSLPQACPGSRRWCGCWRRSRAAAWAASTRRTCPWCSAA